MTLICLKFAKLGSEDSSLIILTKNLRNTKLYFPSRSEVSLPAFTLGMRNTRKFPDMGRRGMSPNWAAEILKVLGQN